MEPLTIIAAATSLVKATGLDQIIGQKLGGNKGAEVASRIVGAAQMVTGTSKPEDALEVMKQNTALQHELKLKLLEMETEEAERILADRKDARDMQKVALQQEDLFSKRFVYVFAAVWSLFTMVYILLITMMTIPAENQRFADTILGFMLGTLITTIINFFFGSSRSSQQKDTTMAALSSVLHRKE